jgi:hypothetical protein
MSFSPVDREQGLVDDGKAGWDQRFRLRRTVKRDNQLDNK